MRERIYRYLRDSGGAAALDEVLQECAGLRGGSPAARGPLASWITLDPRLEMHGALLRLRPGHDEPGARLLEDTPFVIVDLETTGTSGAAAITEIGAVRVRGGRMQESWSTLVNPGATVPWRITQLTGIHDEMLQGQPSIMEAFPRFLEFAGDAVLVAHNAPFDMGFLRRACRNVLGRDLENKALCTVRLSRRLLPRLRSYGLDAVASHVGVQIPGRHRALGDALATARIFLHLLDLARGRGEITLGHLTQTP